MSVGVVFILSLPMDGSMAANHGAPEAVHLCKAWTKCRPI